MRNQVMKIIEKKKSSFNKETI
jgi:dynein heavy chain 2, cytosolic